MSDHMSRYNKCQGNRDTCSGIDISHHGARTLKEDVKILYMSGYTGEMIARRGIDKERMALLSKPFTPNVLLAKVREILDGSGG